MTTRTAYLDFRESGATATTGKIISLAAAQAKLKRTTAELAPVLQQASTAGGLFERVVASSTAKVAGFGAAFGPAGQGLAMIAARAPMAAMGLAQYAAAGERAGLMQRTLNMAVFGGAATMTAGAVAALAYADNAVRAGDSYQALTSRIRANTSTMIEAATAERALYANAADSRGRVDDQARLFNRIMPALSERGQGSDVGLDVTRFVSKGIALGGASPVEQSTAMQQLAQGLGSGALAGDELKTMREAAPQLLRYIAQNLELNGKIGVSFGQLKTLGAAGALTTDRIVAALLRAGPQIEKDFINAPKAAQAQWGVLMDTITRGVGQFAVASGAQSGLVEWLADLSSKADEFRKKMVYDPKALSGFKAATAFVGDAVGSIGQLGGMAVQHFDEIVTLGQLIIALKLGDVFAGWFQAAATGAKSAIGNAQAFVAAARGEAAATGTAVERGAAAGLRSSAQALTLQATELQARADIAGAQAAAAKAAADRAAAQAADMRALHGAGSTAALEAETIATAQAALATKLEEQAKRAETAATNASAAASVRNTVAQQAEAAVTGEVTAATLAKNIAAKAGLGLYTLLGGAWGIAAIAVGALAFAVWKAEEAHRAEVGVLREKLVISDQLRALTDRLTAATWAQVPALQAKAAELRQTAIDTRKLVEAELQLARERKRAAEEALRRGGGGKEGSTNAVVAIERADKKVRELQGVLSEADADVWRKSMEDARLAIVGFGREADRLRGQLGAGKDAAGRALTPEARATAQARLDTLFAIGQAQVDELSARQARQQAAADREKDPKRKASLIAGLTLYGDNLSAATDLVTTADRTPAVGSAPAAGPGKPKTVSTPAPVTAAYMELLKQEFRPKAGLDRFSLSAGGIADSTIAGGGAFKARSEDEAAAAAKYVLQIEAINTATDAEIAKTGESREALRQAASARLDWAVATSQASQAEDRWADIQAEANGQSRAVIKAEREINDLREKGAAITDEAAAAYVAYVTAREKAKRIAAALSFDAPIARDAADAVLSRSAVKTDARGMVDAVAETRRIEASRAQIILESEADVRAASERDAQEHGLNAVQAAQDMADRIAANKLAVEADLQERILKLNRQRIADQVQYEEDMIRKAASSLEGVFHDAVFGGDLDDIGKRLVSDLLETIYQELIGNPLRKLIQDVIRAILHPPTDEMGNAAGGGSGAVVSTVISTIGKVFGFEDGGLFKGAGGPRDDANLVRISNGEFIVNAMATRGALPLLQAINSGQLPGVVPGFADGGLFGAARELDSDPHAGARALLSLGHTPGAFSGGGGERRSPANAISIGHIDASVNAPFAESAQLRQVTAQQNNLIKNLPDLIVGVVRKAFGRG